MTISYILFIVLDVDKKKKNLIIRIRKKKGTKQ